MKPKEELFCSYLKLPAEEEPIKFAETLREKGARVFLKNIYLCFKFDRSQTSLRDSSRPSALRMTTEDWHRKYKNVGNCTSFNKNCRPKVAECRFARLIEPQHKANLETEPKIINGIQCFGEDLCVLENCNPQPRFAQDYN